MNWWLNLWWALLPVTNDALLQNRIGLVIGVCLLFTVIFVVLILLWLITGHLQQETVVVALIYLSFFGVISTLAYLTYWVLASWLLIILLTLSIAADTFYFGVSSPTSAIYVIPILLAAFNLNLQAAVVLTALITAFIWFCALAELTDWYTPQLPKAPSHRTFNAPVMTVTLFTVALVSSLWSQSLLSMLS